MQQGVSSIQPNVCIGGSTSLSQGRRRLVEVYFNTTTKVVAHKKSSRNAVADFEHDTTAVGSTVAMVLSPLRGLVHTPNPP